MILEPWDIWERADSGPMIPGKTFDTRVVFPAVQRLVQKYSIKYEPEIIVPLDDAMIDRAYEAGLELLVEVGMLCTTSERVIKFTRDEVLDTLAIFRPVVVLGQGEEAVEVVHRGIEDERVPRVFGGPISCPVSEDLVLPAYEAYAREPALDAFLPGTQTAVRGRDVKPDTPLEICAEKLTLAHIREALRRANRPGLPILGSNYISSMAPVAAMHEDGYRTSDVVCLTLETQMKVNYGAMSIAEAARSYGCHFSANGTGFIGGFFGGPEGAAIGLVAETLGAYLVYGRPDIMACFAADMMYVPGCAARQPMWVASLVQAALARHTNFVWWATAPYAAYAGPCTDMYFYEIAASTAAQVICGGNPMHGSGRMGVGLDAFGGPLDTRFTRDVAVATTKLDRREANDIVNRILSQYEDRIFARNPPHGKTFQECNDLDTLQPTQEHLDLYETTKKELRGLGLRMD